MLFKTIIQSVILLVLIGIFNADAQQTKHFNLIKLLNEDKLVSTPNQQTQKADSSKKQAISTKGVMWLKNVTFKNGTIDIDLRGKDVFLQSFLGIAFHAKDTTNYDVIYFRPFRFQSSDVPTRKWSVQYISMPDYDYVKLRRDHPGIYENAVNPAPAANDWFHATIVIRGEWITVYVNHSTIESLKIKKLNNNTSGNIGLWTSGLSGDFANLSIQSLPDH
jgi:hypothetical protein